MTWVIEDLVPSQGWSLIGN